MCEITLDRLRPYNACEVIGVEEHGEKRRLLELGFTPGAKLVWLFDAPCGEPTAYWVGGAVIALRRSEAARIAVSCEGESNEKKAQ